MDIDDEWIYRLRHYGPSERIKILGIIERRVMQGMLDSVEDGVKTALRG